MKLSYHQSGKAVDFYGWVQGRAVWEMRYYDDIAEAMRLAAHELGIDGMSGVAHGTSVVFVSSTGRWSRHIWSILI